MFRALCAVNRICGLSREQLCSRLRAVSFEPHDGIVRAMAVDDCHGATPRFFGSSGSDRAFTIGQAVTLIDANR